MARVTGVLSFQGRLGVLPFPGLAGGVASGTGASSLAHSSRQAAAWPGDGSTSIIRNTTVTGLACGAAGARFVCPGPVLTFLLFRPIMVLL